MQAHVIAVEDLGLDLCHLAGGKHTDGRSVVALSVASALTKRGHQVDLLVPAGRRLHPFWASSIRVRHVQDNRIPGCTRAGRPYDACLVNHWSVADRVSDVPIVYQLHEIESLREERTGQTNRQAVEMQACLLRQASAVLVASRWMRAWMLDRYVLESERVRIAPHGIDATVFKPYGRDEARRMLGVDKKRRVILYVGPVEIRKGLSTLMAAFERINHDDAQLWIAGGVPANAASFDRAVSDALIGWAGQPGLSHRVRLLGATPWLELPLYYSAADLVALPSLMEPFGLPTLETIACGTPVVGSSIDGFRELIRPEKDGLLVPPGDAAALAKAIHTVLENPRWHTNRLRHARVAHARTFTWDRAAITIEALIEDVRTVAPASKGMVR